MQPVTQLHMSNKTFYS